MPTNPHPLNMTIVPGTSKFHCQQILFMYPYDQVASHDKGTFQSRKTKILQFLNKEAAKADSKFQTTFIARQDTSRYNRNRSIISDYFKFTDLMMIFQTVFISDDINELNKSQIYSHIQNNPALSYSVLKEVDRKSVH